MVTLLEAKSKFQHIKIDEDPYNPGEIVLYLDASWQCSSRIEQRYHEAIATIPMAAAPEISKVLICGGGDGMALREAVRFPACQEAILVEIDSGMVEIFRDMEQFAKFNSFSMKDPKSKIIIEDASKFIEETKDLYDVIILDFPSPTDGNYDKKYNSLLSVENIKRYVRKLKRNGILSMQSSLPYKILVPIAQMFLDAGFLVWQYDSYYTHTTHDAFMVASKCVLQQERDIPQYARFASKERVKTAFSVATEIKKEHLDYYRLFFHAEEIEVED